MILSTLRERTRSLHHRLEQRIDPFRSVRTPEAYQALLVRFYGFVEPFERELALAPVRPAVELARRRKAPLLERDLLALGATPAQLAAIERCAEVPRPASAAAAMGQLYVLEGSTLGARHMARHFAQTLGVTPASGGAYFHAYGPETDEMWQAFREALSAYDAEREPVVDAAMKTFEAMERWFARAPGEEAP